MSTTYARLPNRVKAAVIDSITLIILMYSITQIFSLFETVPNYVRGGLFFVVFFLYEPILVSLFGRTLGHLFCDIVVKSEHNEKKNIPFHIAFIRFILKALLGWISLLTVTGNEKNQAIHDKVAKSIVIGI
jgi:uncharacterized RDD family membrane protein YckC|nr:RDD family protein [uncultured Psychroserpens sp.]